MLAPLVALVIDTLCVVSYLPAAGLNTGYIALIVYPNEAIELLIWPAFMATARTVSVVSTTIESVYSGDVVVGTLPSTV